MNPEILILEIFCDLEFIDNDSLKLHEFSPAFPFC